MSFIIRFYKSLFISRRWYQLGVAVIVLFVLSYGVPVLFVVAKLALLFLVVVTLLDYVVLFATRQPVEVERQMADRFSNGDENKVLLRARNRYPFPVSLRIIDELPEQFQRRDFRMRADLQCLYQKPVPADRPAEDHCGGGDGQGIAIVPGP
jgi:uncharacterized protein (DUF58 family)